MDKMHPVVIPSSIFKQNWNICNDKHFTNRKIEKELNNKYTKLKYTTITDVSC